MAENRVDCLPNLVGTGHGIVEFDTMASHVFRSLLD